MEKTEAVVGDGVSLWMQATPPASGQFLHLHTSDQKQVQEVRKTWEQGNY